MPPATRTGPREPGDADGDLELARAAVRSERAAVDRFFERMQCVPAILAAKNRRLGSPLSSEELADLAQETLTLLWKKLPGFAGHARLETWAYRFCVLELMNLVRKTKRRQIVQPGLDRTPEPSQSPEPAAVDYEHVYRALDALGDPEAAIVRLKHFRQLTFDEIGATLGISPNTAKTGYYRGLVRLRADLERRGEEEA